MPRTLSSFIATPSAVLLLTTAHQSSCMVTGLLDRVSPHTGNCLLLFCYQTTPSCYWKEFFSIFVLFPEVQ